MCVCCSGVSTSTCSELFSAMNKISGFLNAVSYNSIDYMTSTRTVAQAGKDNAFVVSLDGEGGREGGS